MLKIFKEPANFPVMKDKKGNVVNIIKKVRVKENKRTISIGKGDGKREVANGENYILAIFARLDENGNEIAWVQPLVIMRNNYPSSTLNRWDGNSIEINEKEGYIVAPAIAAGKKHDDNTFSGVMIGDWADKDEEYGGTAEEITKHTGLYGFHHGAISYAF
jgi:hypothetical protein